MFLSAFQLFRLVIMAQSFASCLRGGRPQWTRHNNSYFQDLARQTCEKNPFVPLSADGDAASQQPHSSRTLGVSPNLTHHSLSKPVSAAPGAAATRRIRSL
ncbi:hypothetical protein K438DRAFT_508116 [Mycena galopus ATCC 62051]|nr:hypothetical protein K438DRAFT_508116 [Mycena galopus ATCC 62051]